MHFSQALILSVLAAGILAAPLAVPEPHHTEAQIAAKKAAKANQNNARQAPDDFGPWDSTEDEFGSWVTPRDAEPEAHHTEAQIAAKKKAKGNSARDAAPEAHHTEAQIAAKKAAKANKNNARQAPDDFGPWDSTEDEFGSWVTPRDAEAEADPHHTEAQIAAKKKAQAAKGNTARDAEPEAEAHHTEAQIAAKKAKAQKSTRNADPEAEAHHTEAQIAAKKAAAAKKAGSN